MRGILLKGFFRCKALSSTSSARTRKRKTVFPLPQVKRWKLTHSSNFVESVEDCSSKENVVLEEDVRSEENAGVCEGAKRADKIWGLSENSIRHNDDALVSSGSPGEENFSLYPSVAYEGNVATVKLGVGQMVILDGCAMVQVVEGQASMLGYSLPRGVDILVCSSSKLAEVITFEARIQVGDINMTEEIKEIEKPSSLGCELRFASHGLGKQESTSEAVSGSSLSFKLGFAGLLDSSPGMKGEQNFVEKINQEPDSRDMNESESDDDDLALNSEASYSESEDEDDRDDQVEVPLEGLDMAADTETVGKRKGGGLNSSNVKRQRVVEALDRDSSATSIPRDWKDAVETITLGSNFPIVAICGAKNVGKSTFARFLVNSLLNRYKEVAYLDTDVGQPEFTAPGCISLHILDTPVVGPPAMHLRTPERCFFYGDVSPKSNPMMYIEHVAELFNCFLQKYTLNSISTIPLVINTHGWVKGIGYDVIVDILNSTVPTHVVQVLASSKKRNLPRNKFWDESSMAETVYVESAVEKLKTQRTARSAHHLRAARLLAYFQQCFGENSAPFPYKEVKLFAQTAMSLVRDTPYEVPFTALKIKHLHSEVPPAESFRCVNACIVGLGVTSVGRDIQDKNDRSRSSLPLCLGLGIVKAVDVTRGVFYISTPVPQEQLKQVDILLQGRVEIPVPLLMAKGYLCPYLKERSQLVEGVGAGAMKSTRKPSAKEAL